MVVERLVDLLFVYALRSWLGTRATPAACAWVGAPLTYVRQWRMTVASERLARGDRIAVVASLVGYENEFAFAKAFKRVRGVAPGHLRHAAEPVAAAREAAWQETS